MKPMSGSCAPTSKPLPPRQRRKKLRDDKFRRESAIYERKMAAYRAAKRKYDADRAEYEAELARRR